MSLFSKYLHRGGGLMFGSVLGIYAWDRGFNDSTLGRNVRTLYTASLIIGDYKLNFHQGNADKIGKLHTRTAERILECCQLNGGLYIKFGQQIAQQAAILPPQYNQVLKVMYDKAPVVSYEQVSKIFMEEFGCEPTKLFRHFEHEAFASASIAQVHKAELWDGTPVAVKVQKPYIKKQLEYDLFIYRILCYTFESVFDLPIYWSTDYTEHHLRQEVDFEREGRNAEKCHEYMKGERALAPHVYVPKVYWEQTSPRVLTAEWIDGTSLTDPGLLESRGFSLTHIMSKIVDLFAHQIFVSGFVHCDPHPGNILVRNNPNNNQTQIVILDHGLYIQEKEHFRHQYSLFWKSLFMVDTEMVKTIATQWGIGDPELFAAATLFRPYKATVAPHLAHKKSAWGSSPSDNDIRFADQMALKERATNVLKNTGALPREFIFVGRNMNIVRANNKLLGSPVNRIGRMAEWAVQGLGNDWSNWGARDCQDAFVESTTPHLIDKSWSHQFAFYFRYLQFKSTLFAFSLGFFAHWVYQNTISWLYRSNRVIGFEDTLDDSVAFQVKDKLGVDLSQVYEG